MNFSRTHLTIPGTRAPWVTLPEQTHYRAALVISVILHFAFLWMLAKQHFNVPNRVIEIELTSLPEPQSRQVEMPQIVAPPEKREEQSPPDKPSFRSDIDSQTATEQIKRGDGEDAGNPNPKSESQEIQKESPQQPPQAKQEEEEHVVEEKKPQPQKQVQREKVPNSEHAIKESLSPAPLKQLALDSGTLLEKFSKPVEQTSAKQAASRLVDPQQYRAFSRPSGSGARFIGQQGTSDFLPNLPDGDITLLNTKADQFAVFVRRVAMQVFGEIRNTGWEVLASSDINNASQFSTFRAILSLKGELLRVDTLSSSGSARFDGAIERAVKIGARDRNPPAAAVASDGNIHFIFQAKSWSQFVANQRTGAPMERRWLLLATGLE